MISKKIKILGISGSTRRDSTSESILKVLKEYFHETIEIDIYTNLADLPHFNPDFDTDKAPNSVEQFRERIKSSDAVLFCTPEYVFSLPGSLKNAIEWTVSTTLFSSKPVGMIVAAASGEKAFESLELILVTLESILSENSKLLIKGAKGKRGKDGKFNDSKIFSSLKKLVEFLVLTIEGRK